MRAVIFYGPKEIRLTEIPVPNPGPGEVLIKIRAALTCGTDFKAYRQGHRVLLGEPPSPFGHELAGTIAGVGAGVQRFKNGMRVVAANSAPCERCFYCGRGQSNLCENLKLHNGAYADYILIPAHIVAHNLYEIDPSVDFRVAALAEPLSCALHAVDVMEIEESEKTVILGAGNMALLLIQALKARGAQVFVAGRNRDRLETASKAGADRVASVLDGGTNADIRKWSDGRGPDCVFEAVGRPEAWEQAVSWVRSGGRACLFGGCAAGTQVSIDAHRIHYSQLTLKGVFHHTPKYFKAAVDLLSQGRINTDVLIANDIALEDVPSFFERMHHTSNPKVAVIP